MLDAQERYQLFQNSRKISKQLTLNLIQSSTITPTLTTKASTTVDTVKPRAKMKRQVGTESVHNSSESSPVIIMNAFTARQKSHSSRLWPCQCLPQPQQNQVVQVQTMWLQPTILWTGTLQDGQAVAQTNLLSQESLSTRKQSTNDVFLTTTALQLWHFMSQLKQLSVVKKYYRQLEVGQGSMSCAFWTQRFASRQSPAYLLFVGSSQSRLCSLGLWECYAEQKGQFTFSRLVLAEACYKVVLRCCKRQAQHTCWPQWSWIAPLNQSQQKGQIMIILYQWAVLKCEVNSFGGVGLGHGPLVLYLAALPAFDQFGEALEPVRGYVVEGLLGELVFALDEGAQFEVVAQVDRALYGQVVPDHADELFLQPEDLVLRKKGENERKVSGHHVDVLPHLFGHDQRAQDDGPPVAGQEGRTRLIKKTVYVDQGADAALGAELRAVVKRLYEFVDVLNGGHLAQVLDLLEGEGLGVEVAFLGEEEEGVGGGDRAGGLDVVEHEVVENAGAGQDDGLDVGRGRTGADEHGGGSVYPLVLVAWRQRLERLFLLALNLHHSLIFVYSQCTPAPTISTSSGPSPGSGSSTSATSCKPGRACRPLTGSTCSSRSPSWRKRDSPGSSDSSKENSTQSTRRTQFYQTKQSMRGPVSRTLTPEGCRDVRADLATGRTCPTTPASTIPGEQKNSGSPGASPPSSASS